MDVAIMKNNIHRIIDKISNEQLLQRLYSALRNTSRKESVLWKTLTPEEQEEALKAFEESENSRNLVSHRTVKARYSKWLTR